MRFAMVVVMCTNSFCYAAMLGLLGTDENRENDKIRLSRHLKSLLALHACGVQLSEAFFSAHLVLLSLVVGSSIAGFVH